MTKARDRLINVIIIVMVVTVLGATAWYYFSQYDDVSRENIRHFVRSFGAWAPVAYFAIYVISSPVPFLAPILSAVAGLLFGMWEGIAYALLSATVSSFVPFTLARRLGQDWVQRQISDHKVEELYNQSHGRSGFTFVMLMRLAPILPWVVQNYVAGVSEIAPLTFAGATLLGIIPGTATLVLVGSTATNPTSWEFYLAVGIKIVTMAIPIGYTLWRRKQGGSLLGGSEDDDA